MFSNLILHQNYTEGCSPRLLGHRPRLCHSVDPDRELRLSIFKNSPVRLILFVPGQTLRTSALEEENLQLNSSPFLPTFNKLLLLLNKKLGSSAYCCYYFSKLYHQDIRIPWQRNLSCCPGSSWSPLQTH